MRIRTPKNSIKKWSTKHKVIAVLAAAAGIFVILAFSAMLYMSSLLDKINYVGGSGITTSGENAELSQNGVINILLIGTDSRSDSTDSGRSDSMILISVNTKSSKIIMTSFMRDMYVAIPGHGKNRINASFAYGGAGLLLKTINTNFDLSLNKYVIVDFYSFIDIINDLGGINIDVKDSEVSALNDVVKEINKLEGLNLSDGLLKKGGDNILLTGKQALGYARIRHVGNADFERTQRQRTVLTKVIAKLKSENIVTLTSVLNELLPNVTTNLSKSNIESLILNSVIYSRYTIEQDRIPVDGSYTGTLIRGMDVLKVDFEKNINELQSKIYGSD